MKVNEPRRLIKLERQDPLEQTKPDKLYFEKTRSLSFDL